MNLKEIKLYTLIILKNPIIWLGIVWTGFISIMHVTMEQNSTLSVMEVITSYGILAYSITTLIISTYIAGKDIEIISFYNRNIFKRAINQFCALLIVTVIPTLINLFISLAVVNKESYSLLDTIGFITSWLVINGFLSAIGIFSGTLFKNFFRYPFSLIMYMPFMIVTYSFRYDNTIKLLLNIYGDNMANQLNKLADTFINSNYILDKVFIVNIIMLFFIFIYFIEKRKKTIFYCIVSIIFLAAQIFVYVGAKNTISVLPYRYEDNEKIENMYVVKNIHMNLSLEKENYVKNYCTVKLDLKEDINEIALDFTSLMKIDEVNINGDKAIYDHNDDKLIVQLKKEYGREINIDISYNGYIYARMDNSSPIAYNTDKFINLNWDNLSWYPSIMQDKLINFEINLDGNIDGVYSNLNETSDSIYTGKSKGALLTKGNYKEFEYNDIKIVTAISAEKDEIIARISEIMNNPDYFTEKEYEVIKGGEIKKVMFVPYANNTIIIDDDVLILYMDWI